MKIKRIVSMLMALTMLMCCFAGCGKDKEKTDEEVLMPSVTPQATGRYIEKTISLPEAAYSKDMVMLSDGRLRIALVQKNGNVIICTSGMDKMTWEETNPLPSEISASGSVEVVSLASDGRVFCSTVEDLKDNTYQSHLWLMEQDGTYRELPMTYQDVLPERGYFLPFADFTEDGRLFAQIYKSEVREIDLTTGQFGDNISELESTLCRIGCAGKSTYMLGILSTSYHHDGETTHLPDVLKTQIEASLEADQGNTPKMTFWENQDGYLFFTTREGLYSFIPGGSMTEELINGSRTSLGDPTCVPISLTGSSNGSFYLLCDLNHTPTLCHFTYDTEAPAVAEKELNIYSLYADEDLNQMISLFQKSHLDISVELEVGLTGEDGITEADAIRTLNTEILAGKGPDLICLDGFDLNTYLEKGLLADISSILANDDPLLEQITHCYEENGKICALPTTFTIPAVYGAKHIVSNIHDLPSLVVAAKQARQENPEMSRIVNAMHPVMLADIYYDSCSAAWMNTDGTLNKETLTEFYEAMWELYALDEDFRLQNQDWVAELEADLDSYYVPGEYTGIGGAPNVFGEVAYLSSGTLDGMNHWSNALAGEKEFLGDGYTTISFSGQVPNVFLPRRIMGILTTSAHPQAAQTFLSFMLSDEVQSTTLSTGFPVNQITFNREIAEEGSSDYAFGAFDSDGNFISYSAQWPNAAQRQQLKVWVINLSTPAQTNRTIRKMVMAQMSDCCNGVITPEQAAEAAIQSLNLYLSE